MAAVRTEDMTCGLTGEEGHIAWFTKGLAQTYKM